MEKILVLRGGALGDFIVTLPALALLREQWPAAKIELAGNATAAQLAVARGLINAVHSQHEARWAQLFDEAPLVQAFENWLAEFDLVVSYWPDPDGELARHFPLRLDQRFVSASPMPADAPAAAHYCNPLQSLGLQPRSHFFSLSPIVTRRPDNDGEDARASRATIVIHPGSGSPRKNWPAEHWLRLIEGLPAPVSLILGEAELPVWGAWGTMRGAGPGPQSKRRLGIKPLHHSDPRGVLINRPLEELVDHLATCRFFLGHDSGISHLAAACGANCILLFGPTEPEVWAPPAPHVQVLRRDSDPASLSFDAVQRAVMEALADQT